MCLVNQNLADVPVIVAAIDPCLSCTCRMVVVNQKSGMIVTDTTELGFAGDPGGQRYRGRP
jgi:coenzyme F420-reducing hydrogenase alpha subunit